MRRFILQINNTFSILSRCRHVAYELYKLDNKLLDNTRTIVEFNTVSVNNSNNIKILTREEINNLIYKDNNTKIKILHTHVKEVSTRVRYEKSPLLKHS